MKMEISIDNKKQSITEIKFSDDFNVDAIGILERCKFLLLTPPPKEEVIEKPKPGQIKRLIN